jgi:predicted MFS family arabinose efflux permease
MNRILAYFPAVYHRFSPSVWIISLVGVLNSVAISLSLPFLALYLYQKRGVSMAMVGVVVLISGVTALIAQLLAGTIADKMGRRPLLMVTMITSILLYTAMAVSIGYNAPVPVIVLLWALERSTLNMQRPAIQSMTIDLSPKERLAETFGLMIIGGNLGFAAGPALGGYLAVYITYAWLFALGAVIIGIAFLLCLFRLRESFHGSTEKVPVLNVFSAARDRQLLLFTGICLLLYLVSGQMSSTLSVYTVSHAGFTTAQFGTLLTLNGLMITVLQYPATRLLGRFSMGTALVTGALFYGVGYLTMTWVGPYGLALAGMAVITSGEICCTPTIMTVVGKLASTNWRGRYMAFFGMSETLGMSLGPLLGGFLLDKFPQQPLFVWGVPALLAGGAAVGFGWFGRRLNKPASPLSSDTQTPAAN